ncbi:MAG: hypothetical protein WCQ65_10985 [Fermentimonas sp.]
MDTSEQYIRMCASLPAEMIELLPFEPVCINGEPRRLPRFDNLLYLIAERGGNLEYGVFTLRNFYNFVDSRLDENHGWGLEFPSLEQIALCYVMWIKYEFIWTGEKWEGD